MTDAVETIVCDPVRDLDERPVAVAVVHPDVAEFLDDAWAQEFDRRLAAWEAESSSVGQLTDAMVHL